MPYPPRFPPPRPLPEPRLPPRTPDVLVVPSSDVRVRDGAGSDAALRQCCERTNLLLERLIEEQYRNRLWQEYPPITSFGGRFVLTALAATGSFYPCFTNPKKHVVAIRVFYPLATASPDGIVQLAVQPASNYIVAEVGNAAGYDLNTRAILLQPEAQLYAANGNTLVDFSTVNDVLRFGICDPLEIFGR